MKKQASAPVILPPIDNLKRNPVIVIKIFSFDCSRIWWT